MTRLSAEITENPDGTIEIGKVVCKVSGRVINRSTELGMFCDGDCQCEKDSEILFTKIRKDALITAALSGETEELEKLIEKRNTDPE